MQAKISLLAKLSFGKTVPVSGVPAKGISKIASVDFEYAKILKVAPCSRAAAVTHYVLLALSPPSLPYCALLLVDD